MKIHWSDRLEELAEGALTALCADGRGPFEKSCVIVSNPLRAQWLKRCVLLDGFAGARTVLANVEFRTLDRFIAEAMKAMTSGASPVLDCEEMTWRFYGVLSNADKLAEDALTIPREYLLRNGSVDPSRAFGLAQEVARLFANYQAYRPEMLRVWSETGVESSAAPDEVWQCALWRHLGYAAGFPTGEMSAEAIARARQGYRSLIVFDVPCMSKNQRVFLTAIGASFYQVESADIGFSPGLDPNRENALQLHSCYSVRRELEAIRNGLYDWFDEGQMRDGSTIPIGSSSRRPRTALVLCADFANYAPVVESVFGADAERGELKVAGVGPSIPVKVFGRVTEGAGAIAETFEALFRIPEGRFACSELMNILGQPAVAARFGIGDEDRRFVKALFKGANIRWGYDDAHVRAVLGLGENSARTFPFTWRRGLDRLLLGALEGEVGKDRFGVVDVGSIGAIKPNATIRGEQARRAARLDRFVEAVNAIRTNLPEPHTTDGWSDELHGIVDTFFSRLDEHSSRAVSGLHRAIETVVHRLRELDGEKDARQYPFALVRDAVLREVDALFQDAARRRTVANAVVFAPLSVGAAFPADLVWICGLNNAVFPRKEHPRSFDLVAVALRNDDPSPRAEDRLAFAEAVRCARRRLVFSYRGRDAKTNQEYPPSVLVAELEERIGKLPRREHVLHGFNARYFSRDSQLTSWSVPDYKVACLAQKDRQDKVPDVIPAFEIPEGGTSEKAPVEIDIDDLCAYCNDQEKFLRVRVLNAVSAGAADAQFDDTESWLRKSLVLSSLKGEWCVRDRVACLALREQSVGRAEAECFLASLKEDGLIADDYDSDGVLDVLKAVWTGGEALRNVPQHLLGGLKIPEALEAQGRTPADFKEVKTAAHKLEGCDDEGRRDIWYRIVGRIPVVPGTNIHLQSALAGDPPKWEQTRLAVYRELAERGDIDVRPYEARIADEPLAASSRVIKINNEEVGIEDLLRMGFGLQPIVADQQGGSAS